VTVSSPGFAADPGKNAVVALRAFARRHRFGSWLTLIAIVGFVLRVVYDLVYRHHAVGGDGFRYHFGAQLLADGQGFVGPLALILRNSHVPDTGHPPGWTILLAGPTKLGLRTWLDHQLIASVIGTATIVMTGLAGRAAFGIRAGLIAAGLAVVYPFVWVYEREVLSEPLAMLGIATIIWLAYKFLASPGLGWAVALGAVVGMVAMTKSDQIAIAFVLIVPLILSRCAIDLRRRIGWLASAAAVCAAIMAPWSIYLSTRFDRPVVVAGAVGATMAAGNCAQTYHGPLLGWYVFGCSLGFKQTGDPITNDDRARSRALTFMREHKSRLPAVMAARIGRTFGFFRPSQQMHLETQRGTSLWVFQVGFFAYWALLPVAVAGAVISRRRGVAIYPLLVFPAVVVLTVLLTIGSVRYRAPAEIPLVLLAAVALDAAAAWWRRRRSTAERLFRTQ
jgi:4-amino-4-deoxy-L-arabinose transferase-like glycosyltransferase